MTLSRLITGVALTLATTVGFATTQPSKTPPSKSDAKPVHHIAGNPLNARDNFTINSQTAGNVAVKCRFINTGNTIADLYIWTNPKQSKPAEKVHLEASKLGKAVIVSKTFHLKTAEHWWCLINVPNPTASTEKNCAYLAIADATLLTNNPFAIWDKVIRPKETSYQCQIVKPSKAISFYAFVR